MPLEGRVGERRALVGPEEQHPFLHRTEDQILDRPLVPVDGLAALELLRGGVGAPLGEGCGAL